MAERFPLRRWATTRWFDPALAIAVTAICLVELWARPELTRSPLATALVLLFGAPIAVRRTHPLAAACAAAVAIVAGSGIHGEFSPQAHVATVLILAYSCGAHASWRDGLLAVGALVVASQIELGLADFPNLEIALVTLPPWWVGREVRQRGELVRALGERNRELEAEEDAFVRLSVRRERARIARELHDIVSHHLAVIVVQAGAGRVARELQSNGAADRFASIRESGAHALAEMARLVDVLEADAGVEPLDRLQLLLDQAQGSGIELRATIVPRDLRLPAELEEAAYRVVQEGLTNAIKHARGAEVHVRVAALDDALEVVVRNARQGDRSTLAETGSGSGLAAMRERVEALGGTLAAGPEPTGDWCLRACLRLSASAITPAP